MIKQIFNELKEHAPFTFLGALSGILIFILFRNLSGETSLKLFYTFHPLHVFLSAYITTSMYKLHKKAPNLIKLFIVGFVGSIGVATLSDSVLPFLGETLLNLQYRELHLGFIEKWYIVYSTAILGIVAANFVPNTKFPHSAHVFVSTLASLFHIMMSVGGDAISIQMYFAVLFLLFLSVWLPCCFSDIAFPLLFVKGHDEDCPCHKHGK